MLLVFQGAVGEAPLPMRVGRLRESMPRFAFVQASLAGPAQQRPLEPVNGKERALDTPDLSEREVEAVLALVGAKLLQHRRGRDTASLDRRAQAQNVVPALGDGVGSNWSANQRLETLVA